MERIKKRLETALNHLMLAENEVNRLRIMKKPVCYDESACDLIKGIKACTDRIVSMATEREG